MHSKFFSHCVDDRISIVGGYLAKRFFANRDHIENYNKYV